MSLYDKAYNVLIPSGYKAGELYSVKPNTAAGDFDVVRNSLATRTNVDLKLDEQAVNVPCLNYDTANGCPQLYVNEASTNLLTYPVSFGNSYWTKSGATIEGSTTNILSTDYTSDFSAGADSWAAGARCTVDGNIDGIAGVDDVLRLTSDATAANTHYAKRTATLSATNPIYRITFDYYIPSANTNCDGLVFPDSGFDLYSVLDAWTSVTVESRIVGTELRIYMSDGGSITWDGVNTDVVYLKNIVIKNIGGYSAPHTDATLAVSGFKLVEDGTTGLHRFYLDRTSVTALANHTLSVYAKAGENNWFFLQNSTGGDKTAYFDLTNGVVGTSGGTGFVSASITPMADSWYRCDMVSTQSASTTYGLRVGLADADNSNSYTGTSGNGIYIAFAQLEELSYPSAWIYDGTEGSTTSRVADQINNATYSGASESGVLYAEIAAFENTTRTFFELCSISDGSTTNTVVLGFDKTPAKTIYTDILVGGVSQDRLTYTVTDLTAFHKIAVRWKVNDFSLWIDGVEQDTGTSGSSFAADTLTECSFDDGNAGSDFYGKLANSGLATYSYLTDAEMITLTT